METTNLITDKQVAKARAALCRVAEVMTAIKLVSGANIPEEAVYGAPKTE